MLNFLLFGFLLFAIPVQASSSQTYLESVFDIWNEENQGTLSFSDEADPQTLLKLKEVGGRRYWDTVKRDYSEDDIQRFLYLDWDSHLTGRTFLDFKKRDLSKVCL